jgi:hypothetical protein
MPNREEGVDTLCSVNQANLIQPNLIQPIRFACFLAVSLIRTAHFAKNLEVSGICGGPGLADYTDKR